MRYSKLIGILFGMVALDSIFTGIWISQDLAVEGNPVLAALIGAVGIGWGLFLRTLFVLGLILALVLLAESEYVSNKLIRVGLLICSWVYAGVMGLHVFGLYYLTVY